MNRAGQSFSNSTSPTTLTLSISTLQTTQLHLLEYSLFSIFILFYASDSQRAQLCKQNLLSKQKIFTDTDTEILLEENNKVTLVHRRKFCSTWIAHYADARLDKENINVNSFHPVSQTNQLLVCNAVRNGKQ